MAINLSDTELARLRAAHESYMPSTCTIAYQTNTADTIGGWTESWTTRASSVPCRIAPLTGGENVEGERVMQGTGWVLTLHHDQTITATDRVTVGGKTYQVTRIFDRHSYQTATRVELRLLE